MPRAPKDLRVGDLQRLKKMGTLKSGQRLTAGQAEDIRTRLEDARRGAKKTSP